MATTIQSSDLDFTDIKNRLKTYFQQQSEFSDYDFEASGLSNILDVLAYNTHINGLIANFATNESFLNTAQLRSSVVSHAEVLGYSPKSKTASRATVNISVNVTDPSRPNSITLPAYTSFTTQIDDTSFTFQTNEDYIGIDDGSGIYEFKNSSESTDLEILEGTQRTKTFIVGDAAENQIYVIPDDTIDTSSIKVDVYDTVSGSTFIGYTNINLVPRIDSTSKIFQIKEVPNGYYEIHFGDGSVLGARPVAGNKIVVSYISTNSDSANGANSFTPTGDLRVNSVDYPILISTVSKSSGGSEKESISSIKQNATIAFASQQRMVTAEDYKAQILKNYSSYITDVSAWGGNENEPPVYGRVYVSLNFIDGVTDSKKTDIKNDIINRLTNNLAVMSIDTVYSDPVKLYLELNTTFNFDPDQSNLTIRSIESSVNNAIVDYFDTNLSTFNKVFRRSSLLTEIDKLSSAILNSRTEIKAQLRFTPTLGVESSYTLSFPIRIAPADSEIYTLTSSRFTYEGQTCTLKNQLGTTTLQVVNLGGGVLVTNVGSYTPSTGKVLLEGFAPTAFDGDQLKVSVIPANQSTIRPLRNYIIDIDESTSFATAQIDYQNINTRL